MPGNHIGIKTAFVTADYIAVFKATCQKYGMHEDGRLGDFCGFKVFCRTIEHDIGDIEAQDFICTFEQFLGLGVAVVKGLAHSRKLRALAWKNIRFHISILVKIKSFANSAAKIILFYLYLLYLHSQTASVV